MILIDTEVRDTLSKRGMGLFSKEFIPKGTIIWEFNRLIDKEIPYEEIENLPNSVKVFLKKYGYVEKSTGICLFDGMNDRFMNHSRDPNVIFDDSPRGVGIAAVDIKVGDEITCDYRSFDEESKEDLGFDEE